MRPWMQSCLIVLLLWCGDQPSRALGYEDVVHLALSERAAAESIRLGEVLAVGLGFEAGRDTRFMGRTADELIGRGAFDEDDPALRVVNHFHNPLRPWSLAGLSGLGLSSVLWAQDPDQGSKAAGGSWSWKDARERYLAALTGRARDERDKKFAETFLAIGHQLHLVQDASVPAHVRDDAHPSIPLYLPGRSVKIPLNSDWFEDWVEALHRAIDGRFGRLLAGPAPDVSQLVSLPSGDSSAPVPIARLIDTDPGAAGDVGSSEPGVAEYANANFLSRSTIFTAEFPRPRLAALGPGYIEALEGGKFRRYFPSGEIGGVDPLVTEGILYRSLSAAQAGRPGAGGYTLDDELVHARYAEKLLPRAVAYSTALIDYFFRGQISGSGDNLSAGFHNSSEEAMDGTLALYYDDGDETRHPLPGATWSATLGPFEAVTGLRFSPPAGAMPKDPGKYMLVFRGALGNELGAVVGKQVFIPSVIIIRLIKRKDGTPYQGSIVRTIDTQTQEVLSSGVTDQEGKARLTWKPGRTALFILERFPVYWGGEGSFSSRLEEARILRATDVDAEGQLTVALPWITAEWPNRIDACTGYPMYGAGFLQESFLIDPDRLERVTATYGVIRSTFTRGDTGLEVVLCEGGGQFCFDVDNYLVAEDLNRVGEVVGELVRDVFSVHSRQVFAVVDGIEGNLLDTICVEYNNGEVEVLPVTIGER
jgi:hypothetical protein